MDACLLGGATLFFFFRNKFMLVGRGDNKIAGESLL